MGIPERKAREKQKRHQQILDAAYQVFHEVGFSAATMDLIADRAELAKGTIYIYFKSKEDLYFSLLANGLDILIDLLSEMEAKKQLPEQFLHETAKTLFHFYSEYTDYFRIYMLMQMEDMQAKLSPELSREINIRAAAILKLLSGRLQALVDQGYYPPMNTWQIANLLWGAFNGITRTEVTKEQLKARSADTSELLCLCFDLIDRGLKTS